MVFANKHLDSSAKNGYLLMKKQLPLHLHISSLVIGLILILGLSSNAYQYVKTSDLLIGLAQKKMDYLSNELKTGLETEQKNFSLSLDILLNTNITTADNLQQRLIYFPAIQSILSQSNSASALQVGYANGDYFIIKKLALYPDFEQSAPQNAVFMIDNINAANKKMERLYTDLNGTPLQETEILQTQYDPRNRDWYRASEQQEGLYISDAYLFYFAKKMGITFAKSNKDGVVIAGDLTIENFNKKLENYPLTKNAQLIIVNQHQNLVALKNSPLLEKRKNNAFLNQLLTHQNQNIEHEFTWNNENWVSKTATLYKQRDKQLKLIMAIPEKELVEGAIEIRNSSFFIQLLSLLLAIPIAWLMATRIARSLNQLAHEAHKINRFDFSHSVKKTSWVREVNDLEHSISMMRDTINNFLNIVQTISSEKDLDTLIQKVIKSTGTASDADLTAIFLTNDEESQLTLHSAYFANSGLQDFSDKAMTLAYDENQQSTPLHRALHNPEQRQFNLTKSEGENSSIKDIITALGLINLHVHVQPLLNRQSEMVGVLLTANHNTEHQKSESWLAFHEMLSHFSAVTLESRQLIQQQKALLQSFIELIASAIDAKSPYTGGHCQRVPEITKLLAKAACESKNGIFKEFQLSEDEWEELHFAAWLHDCGKVTTPEYVVDKSTKLETIYDRIHEIRTRFEVLKRDAEIEALKLQANQNIHEQQETHAQLALKLQQLDSDFAFIANCNEGGEFMEPEQLMRLEKIADYRWFRTLDDRLGISWEEAQRKTTVHAELPCEERLLCDKNEHFIQRDKNDHMPSDNPWGFNMKEPDLKYNRGELYNLSIQRGTLNNEERFKINDHIVQTIIMLENLPYPKHLKNIPHIAGGHHEKMDGTGYPKKLTKEQMPMSARIMAIADIFEALTAADRPYKKAKSLSESIKIMSFMAQDQHIDKDLFKLFLTSGVYLQYAQTYLLESQLDNVDIEQYLD